MKNNKLFRQKCTKLSLKWWEEKRKESHQSKRVGRGKHQTRGRNERILRKKKTKPKKKVFAWYTVSLTKKKILINTVTTIKVIIFFFKCLIFCVCTSIIYVHRNCGNCNSYIDIWYHGFLLKIMDVIEWENYCSSHIFYIIRYIISNLY